MRIKETILIISILSLGFLMGTTTSYFYSVKPLHSLVENALERSTITNNYDKIKALKGASIGVTNNSEVTEDTSKEENNKWKFFKRKNK